MPSLNRKWTYRSYRPNWGAGFHDIVPWTPPGTLELTTDGGGKVTGTLTFSPTTQLAISGSIIPATGSVPDGVELKGEGMKAKYAIRAYFVGATDHLVGMVAAVENDIAGQPNGTAGPLSTF